MAVLGVACLQGGSMWPFYTFGHPTPYAYAKSWKSRIDEHFFKSNFRLFYLPSLHIYAPLLTPDKQSPFYLPLLYNLQWVRFLKELVSSRSRPRPLCSTSCPTIHVPTRIQIKTRQILKGNPTKSPLPAQPPCLRLAGGQSAPACQTV
jgi:hypothetical protein